MFNPVLTKYQRNSLANQASRVAEGADTLGRYSSQLLNIFLGVCAQKFLVSTHFMQVRGQGPGPWQWPLAPAGYETYQRGNPC